VISNHEQIKEKIKELLSGKFKQLKATNLDKLREFKVKSDMENKKKSS